MNETDIINLLHKHAGTDNKDLVRGIGDDCAVIKKDRDRFWLVTMDTLVESVHFNLDWHPPDKLGRKSVTVNASDIAAMGGTPLFLFLSLGLPPDFHTEWLELFSKGLAESCEEYGCFLAGGDTVRSSGGILITLTVIGEIAAHQVLYRNGAQAGDNIWVSGSLGNSAAGLELFRSGRIEEAGTGGIILAEHHLNPHAQLRLGHLLAQSGQVNSMMDLSDGLATDLAHLCNESGKGAVIYSELLPAKDELKSTARLLGKDYLQWMLAGGEDYELIFTVPDEHTDKIMGAAESWEVALTKIGHIEEEKGVRLIQGSPDQQMAPAVDISYIGFDHFRKVHK